VVARRDFRQLQVWAKAHQLALASYRSTGAFPAAEQFSMTSQVRRAAVSVPANIAEGCGRGGNELSRFCTIAFGSATEIEYLFLLAHELGYLSDSDYETLTELAKEVQRMLNAFIRSLEPTARQAPSG
jgi:four helix bundle protein